MSEMEKFFTRQVAQEGRKIPLSYPDGSESPHWITVRGVDSDAYNVAVSKERQRILEMASEEKPTAEEIEQGKLRVLAALIKDWSFEEELTEERLVEFLKEAPQIADQLNSIAADRKLFFGASGKDSKSSQEQKPSSKNQSPKNAG